MAADRLPTRTQFVLTSLIFVHIVICCVSLIRIADYKYPVAFDPTTFHVFFDTARMKFAILSVAALACAAPLFAYARFSFGYFVGFYLYSMILSYLWLNCFSNLAYDHWLAGLSAAASAVAFLLPALFISAPARQACVLSEAAFDRLLTGILLVGVVTIAIGSSFNFKLVGVEDIYGARDEIGSKPLNYLLGMTSGALLPFAFAGFIARKAYWRA